MGSSKSDKIARSPTPPDSDEEAEDGEEWPVHGIVGEDVDVFGVSSYEIRWKNWSRPDGTNTTWMRTIDDPALVDSWNDAMKEQRVKKAVESQSIDLTLLASTPMHDRLTFERAQAVEEKMAERVRRNGGIPGKSYQGWMAEVERQAAHHEQRRRCGGIGQPLASSASKKRGRQPSPNREASVAEGSRPAVSRRRVSAVRDIETSTVSDDDLDTIYSEL